MERRDWCGILDRLASLAKLGLREEERNKLCDELPVIADYLREVSEALKGVDAEPLYHVWEGESGLREGGARRGVDVLELLGRGRVDDEGRVRVPWREVK